MFIIGLSIKSKKIKKVIRSWRDIIKLSTTNQAIVTNVQIRYKKVS